MHWLPFAMVQSINTKAILSIATIIRRPYLASPHVPVNTVSGKSSMEASIFSSL